MKRLTTLLTIAAWMLCLFCASRTLAQTGAVLGFGFNGNGQLGDDTTINRVLPTAAHQISGIKAISSGYSHTLALDSSGYVWAWGYNGQGQLGTGDTTQRTKPVLMMANVRAISAGGYHSMALKSDGSVWVWGDNSMGQLGTGDLMNRLYPTKMSGPFNTRIKKITAAGYHSLILDDQNMLYGCGSNLFGQLAQHDFVYRRPSLVFISRWVKAMAGGFGHTVIQTSYNSVMAAGYNADGAVGDNTTTNTNYFVHCGDNIRAIGAGWGHSLAVRQDGKVLAWGRNYNGELGMGDTINRFVPTEMPGAANVKEVSGGYRHTLLLTAGGNVLATGYNGNGELGDNTTINRTSLVAVRGSANFIGSISAGFTHSMMLRPFTKTLVAGKNNFGQLGINNTLNRVAPVQMQSGNSIIAVAAGPVGNHSLMLRADGSVWATGYNAFGQLGIGTTTDSLIPVRVKGQGGVGFLANIIAIAAGDVHSMALAADGTVYTWGYNGIGALGLGDTSNRLYPVQVPGCFNIFAIAAGGYHSLMLGEYGWVGASGNNSYGQLGLGDTTTRYSFTRLGSSFGQTAVAAGEAHSMSLDYYAGSINAWGNNSYGQLALGDTFNRTTPTYQPGTFASTLACGGVTSMCLNAYGMVMISGYNNTGLLGLGNTQEWHSWTWSNNVPQAIGMAGGYLHSLFLNVYGDVYAAGYGGDGQLGNGATTTRYLPTYIPGAPYTTSVACGAYHSLMLTTPRVMLSSITISPTIVKGGFGATATVRLNGLSGPGGQRVYISWDNSVVNMPWYVDVAPNTNTVSFPISTQAVGAQTVAKVYASMNNLVSTTLTITP